MSKVDIYVLCDPATLEPRYVGQSVNIKNRLMAHLRETSNKRKLEWIKSLNANPVIKVIETVDSDLANDREWFWICQYRAMGYDLLNAKERNYHNRNQVRSPLPELIYFDLPDETLKQLDWLKTELGLNKTLASILAIERLAKQELKKHER